MARITVSLFELGYNDETTAVIAKELAEELGPVDIGKHQQIPFRAVVRCPSFDPSWFDKGYRSVHTPTSAHTVWLFWRQAYQRRWGTRLTAAEAVRHAGEAAARPGYLGWLRDVFVPKSLTEAIHASHATVAGPRSHARQQAREREREQQRADLLRLLDEAEAAYDQLGVP